MTPQKFIAKRRRANLSERSARQDDIARLHQFAVEGTQAVPGVWSLTLEKPTGMTIEDYYVDLVGIPPLLAPTKAAALKPTEK